MVAPEDTSHTAANATNKAKANGFRLAMAEPSGVMCCPVSQRNFWPGQSPLPG